MKTYHKIEGLWKRDVATKRLVPGEFLNETVAFLKDCLWEFTEKIDGTNVRVHWDGHRVTFAGRTDNAQLPNELLKCLTRAFGGEENEQIFEQHFGENPVTLYGEGYGAKIQSGENYRPDQSFILFDVEVSDLFLTRENVCQVAQYFNVDVVPVVLRGTLDEAIEFVKQRPKSTIGTASMEGVVGKPLMELQDRRGNRIIVKIKVRDMQEIERYTSSK